MIEAIEGAFTETLRMLDDGIAKIPDECWREGKDDYFIPVRIAYHIFLGLEWFVTTVPPDEHRKTRRYQLNWLGDVAEMPDRDAMMDDLAWMTGRIENWFADSKRETAAGIDSSARAKKALYFLRHTQHHLGEFSAAARLLQLPRPSWEYPARMDPSIKVNP